MSAPTLRPVARPSLPRSTPRDAGPLAAAAPAALSALLVGLLLTALPVLLVWAADARSAGGTAGAVRAGAQVWLLAHGAPLGLPSGRLSLVPLGLVALPLVLLLRAGAQAARQRRVTDLRGAAVLTAALAGPYALAAGGVAAVAGSPQLTPSVLGAVLGAAVLAAVGGGTGVLRTSALGARLAGRLPDRLRLLLAPAGAAVLVLLAAGALLAGTALALSAPQAAELARAGAPGVVGGVGLLLLGLALVPNAVVWAASWWAGPGFAVGTGTAVGPLAHDLGAVPALPLLAALPRDGVPLGVGLAALLVPLAAGALAGLLVARSGSARPLLDAALCGPGAGAALGLLAWLSAGAAGGRRMSEVGASAWQVALAVAVEVAAGATLVAWLRGRRAAS